jgi:hypothetical protein
MQKVIYFDENSAIDYLEIKNRGKVDQSSSDIKESKGSLTASLGAKVGTSPIINIFSSLFGAEISAEAKTSLSRAGESIMKTTISTSILSQYYDEINKDENITKLVNFKVTIPQNSFTYFKTISPLVTMINSSAMDEIPFDISKFDKISDELKGYFSVFAEQSDIKVVLRFNLKAFRNNYKLNDLAIMNLKFYAIKTGVLEGEDVLSFENEFIHDNSKLNLSLDDLDNSSLPEMVKFDLYDVILAGIEN